jgi:hypothetical protein
MGQHADFNKITVGDGGCADRNRSDRFIAKNAGKECYG